MGIGDNIKKFRNIKGITQKELAKNIGVTPSTIQNYENYRRKPDFVVLNDIADALGCTLMDLVSVDKLKQELTDIEETEKLLNILGYEIKINQIDDEVFEVDIKSKDGLITLSGEEYDKLKGNISLILDYELYKLKRQ